MHPNPTQLFAAGLSMLKGHEMVKDGNQSKWFWWTVGMIPVNLIAPQMFNIDAEHDKTKQNRSTLLSIHKCTHTTQLHTALRLALYSAHHIRAQPCVTHSHRHPE
jgi:hypothetical protein